MSQVQQQQKQHKFQPCRNGCGQLITFDKAFRGKNNGWVPLDEITDSLGQKKLQAHICPARNKQQQPPEQAQPTLAAPSSSPQANTLSGDYLIATLAASIDAVTRKIEILQKEVETQTAAIKELQTKNGGISRKQ